MATTNAGPHATYEDNPFRGPNPLKEGDAIFGRNRDIQLLLDQLLSDRLVLLHSVSGCGKTSLVEAGLRPRLPGFHRHPTVSVKSTEGDTVRGNAMLSALARSLAPDTFTQLGDYSDTDQVVSRLEESLRPKTALGPTASRPGSALTFLFVDQFEETLTDKRISDQERIEFFKALGMILESPTTWAIFGIREDYLGDLQPYLRFLPTQLSSRYRLVQLSVNDAVSAIEMKDQAGKIAFERDAALALALDLARSEHISSTNTVEPVHLQVVCDYLWQHKGHPGHPVSQRDLDALGDRMLSVTAALAEYYDRQLKALAGSNEDLQFRIRKWFDSTLIDRAHERRVRVRLARDGQDIDVAYLNFLRDKYLIRDDERAAPTTDRVVELAHDRLIIPIIHSNDAWLKSFKQFWLQTAEQWGTAPASHLLLTGSALGAAVKWAANNDGKLLPAHRNFLRASEEQALTQNRMRRLAKVAAFAIATLVIVAAVATWWVFQAKRSAREVRFTAMQVQADAERRASDAVWNAQKERDLILQNANAEAFRLTAQLDVRDKETQTLREVVTADESKYQKLLAEQKLNDAISLQLRIDAKNDAADAKSERDNAVAEARGIRDNAAKLQHEALALQLLSRAERSATLSAAVAALQEAGMAGDLALEKEHNKENLIQRTVALNQYLLSRILLKGTLCIKGYFQSFGVARDGTGRDAVDEAGFYYNNDLSEECPQKLQTASRVMEWPSASVVLAKIHLAAFGNSEGDIKVLREGLLLPQKLGLHQQIVDLAFSPDGQYLAASSALWSLSAWKLTAGAETERVFRWPGSAWDPSSWVRWASIFKSKRNQLTNSLSLHTGDYSAIERSMAGVLAAGQEDGCIKLVPINSGRFHSTRPLETFNCKSSAVISSQFSPDGTLLATGARDGTLTLWMVNLTSSRGKGGPVVKVVVEGDEQRGDTAPEDSRGCQSGVTALTFLPGALLAAGCQNGTIHIYDLSDLKSNGLNHPRQVGVLRGARQYVTGTKHY